MPGDEYSSVGGGGKLKLKGGKVKDGRVDKAKKKKRTQNVEQPRSEEGKETKTAKLEDEEGALSVDKKSPALDEDINDEDSDSKRVHYKTEAERKHEERRRKRLNERLLREGVKTHKERVEELNRYLSTLSEHHDMPKIGPG